LVKDNSVQDAIRKSERYISRLPSSNQAAYDGWLQHAYKRVFRCEQALTGPIIAIEAPAVKGLTVYGARNGQTRFYGAWTRRSGIFVGWMRARPNLAGDTPDAVHAIGEVLGRSVFKPEECASCALHDALESFRRALSLLLSILGMGQPRFDKLFFL
jgi:hypothetical protein